MYFQIEWSFTILVRKIKFKEISIHNILFMYIYTKRFETEK